MRLKLNLYSGSLTRAIIEVIAPERNALLNLLTRAHTVTGRKAKTENGHPKITPRAATATAMACLSSRNSPDERDMAYMENELGKKPEKHINVTCHTKNYIKEE